MKNLFIMLLSILSVVGLATNAQTKKTASNANVDTKKTAGTNKKNPVKTSKIAPVKKEAKVLVKPNSPVAKKTNVGSSNYKTAVGLKFIYGISATGKFFLNDNSAIEAIVRYNGAGGLGTNIALTGLYEYHMSIKGVEGLAWYLGGGGFADYFTYKNDQENSVVTYGVSGVIGLEYKIANLPLAISADWLPGYVINDGIGFSAENGGLGIKYTF